MYNNTTLRRISISVALSPSESNPLFMVVSVPYFSLLALSLFPCVNNQ